MPDLVVSFEPFHVTSIEFSSGANVSAHVLPSQLQLRRFARTRSGFGTTSKMMWMSRAVPGLLYRPRGLVPSGRLPRKLLSRNISVSRCAIVTLSAKSNIGVIIASNPTPDPSWTGYTPNESCCILCVVPTTLR